MKRTLALVTIVAVAPGCGAVCPLLGLFVGTFAGDASGDVEIEVTEDPDNEEMADLEIRLTSDQLAPFGSAVITCDDGKFMAGLETNDNADFGDFFGSLTESAGDGEWSFNTGEMGTWDIVKMD